MIRRVMALAFILIVAGPPAVATVCELVCAAGRASDYHPHVINQAHHHDSGADAVSFKITPVSYGCDHVLESAAVVTEHTLQVPTAVDAAFLSAVVTQITEHPAHVIADWTSPPDLPPVTPLRI